MIHVRFMPALLPVTLSVCLVLSSITNAQNAFIDSLKKVLAGVTREDTVKADLLNALSASPGMPNEASARYSTQALSLSKKLDYKNGIGTSLYNLSLSTAEDSAQVNFLLKGIELLADDPHHNHSIRSKLHRRLGQVHFYQDNFVQAMKNFRTALELALTSTDSSNIGWSLNNIANVYQRQHKYDTAFSYYTQGLSYTDSVKERINYGRILGNMGNSLMSLNRYTQAIATIKRSIAVFESAGSPEGVSLRLASLGKAYFLNKENAKSIEAFQKGYTLAKKINYSAALQEALDGMTTYYEAIGDYKNAFTYQNMYFDLKDSLSNAEKATQLLNMERDFEMKQQEKIQQLIDQNKEERHQAEVARQRIITWSAAIGLVMVILFSLLIFRSLQRTRRQKLVIEEKNRLVEEKQKEMLDSIQYARRIQRSLLPTEKYIDRKLREHKRT